MAEGTSLVISESLDVWRLSSQGEKRPVLSGRETDLLGLGASIRDRRKELNLTQTQLGERLGWSQERVSVLETGKYGLPSLPLLAHLAEALELPLSALMEAVGFEVEGAPREGSHLDADGSGNRMDAVLGYTLQRLLGIQALTLRDAMNAASDLMADAVGADKIDLFLYEEETATLVALGTSNTALGRHQLRTGLDRVPIANGGRQAQVFQTGNEYYTGHADHDPEMDRGVVHTLGVRSLYAVPLRVDGEVRGIVVAESVHPDRFSQAERDFFEAASRWIGMVAHRVELHEAVTKQTLEEARRQVAEEILEAVAHVLQNQITPIKGEADLLHRRMQRNGDQREIVQTARISDSLRRLSYMVKDLLDVSRLEGGLFSINRQPLDLVDLVHGVVDAARADREEIEARTPEALIMWGDPGRITQALQNLVGNALTHTPAGVPVQVTVYSRTHDEGEWAIVEVHDEGPGIPADVLPQLFSRHASGEKSAGIGLGLYLARGIATAHSGELHVSSEIGSGTTFTMLLPLDGAAPD